MVELPPGVINRKSKINRKEERTVIMEGKLIHQQL